MMPSAKPGLSCAKQVGALPSSSISFGMTLAIACGVAACFAGRKKAEVDGDFQRVDPRNGLNDCAYLIAKAGCNRVETNRPQRSRV
jgi:hypothetical protein